MNMEYAFALDVCVVSYMFHIYLGKLTTTYGYEKGNRQWTKTTSPWCVHESHLLMYNTLDEVHKVYEAMKNIMEGKIKYAYKKVGDGMFQT